MSSRFPWLLLLPCLLCVPAYPSKKKSVPSAQQIRSQEDAAWESSVSKQTTRPALPPVVTVRWGAKTPTRPEGGNAPVGLPPGSRFPGRPPGGLGGGTQVIIGGPTGLGPARGMTEADFREIVERNAQAARERTVHVRGYYRRDGTYVHSYVRRPPRY